MNKTELLKAKIALAEYVRCLEDLKPIVEEMNATSKKIASNLSDIIVALKK